MWRRDDGWMLPAGELHLELKSRLHGDTFATEPSASGSRVGRPAAMADRRNEINCRIPVEP